MANSSQAGAAAAMGGQSIQDMEPEDIIAMIDKETNPKVKDWMLQSYGWLIEGHRTDISSEHLLDFVVELERRGSNAATFPLTCGMFVSFMIMVLLHSDIPVTSTVDREFRSMLQGTTMEGVSGTQGISGHKDFYDITEVNEVYTYLHDVLLPIFLVADPLKTLTEESPGELNRVLRYNRLIGGVQLQQKRRVGMVCDAMHPGLGMTKMLKKMDCYKVEENSDFTDNCFGPMKFGARKPADRSRLPDGFCGDTSNEGQGVVTSSPLDQDGSGVLDYAEFFDAVAFYTADTDKSSKISRNEALAASIPEVLFDAGDLDHDGQLTVQEFFLYARTARPVATGSHGLGLWTTPIQALAWNVSGDLFAAADKDADGFLTAAEFYAAKKFAEADTDQYWARDERVRVAQAYAVLGGNLYWNPPPPAFDPGGRLLSEAETETAGDEKLRSNVLPDRLTEEPEADESFFSSLARRLRISGRDRSRAEGMGEVHEVPDISFPYAPTFSTVFDSYLGFPGSWNRVEWLRDNNWIDLHTQWVAANAFLINPDLGVYCHVSVQFFFSTGGDMTPAVKISTFVAEPYQFMSVIAVDAFFFVCLVLSTVQFYFGVGHAVHEGYLPRKLQDKWFYYDFILVHSGFMVLLFWAVLYFRMDAIKTLMIEEVKAQGTVTPINMPGAMDPGTVERSMFLINFHNVINDFSEYARSYWTMLCLYMLLTLAGFLRSFKAQPRLNMLSETLFFCFSDVMHLMIVMVLFWIGFAVSGMLIFGRRVFEFATLNRALHTTFNMILGDWDWDKMSDEYWSLVSVWHGSLVMVFIMLLLNMLMAIVMDHYGNVKAAAHVSDPVWVQMYNYVKEYKKTKEWCSASVLEQIIREYWVVYRVDRMDAAKLQRVVPGISKDQAEWLVKEALNLAASKDTTSLSGMTHIIGQVCKSVGEISQSLDALEEEMPDDRYDQLEIKTELETKLREDEKRKKQEAEEAKAAASDTTVADMLARVQEDSVMQLFKERVQRTIAKIGDIEKFVDESVRWTGHRSTQQASQITRIEDLLRQRSFFVDKMDDDHQGLLAGARVLKGVLPSWLDRENIEDSAPGPPPLAIADQEETQPARSMWSTLFGGGGSPEPAPEVFQEETRGSQEFMSDFGQEAQVQQVRGQPSRADFAGQRYGSSQRQGSPPSAGSFPSRDPYDNYDDDAEPPLPTFLGTKRLANPSWAMEDD